MALAVAALFLAVAALFLAVAAAPPPAAHAHPSAAEADVTQCSQTWGGTTIESIRFTSPAGTYYVGDTIGIRVRTSNSITAFDDIQHITTHSRIKLETGAVDRFAEFSGSGSRRVFDYTYTVQAGDRSSGNLDYHSTRALYWDIRHLSPSGRGPYSYNFLDWRQNAINCLLPSPGQAGSLAASASVAVDGALNITSRVQNVTSGLPDGAYGVGAVIPIGVTFNASVTVNATGGRPLLALDTGGATGRHVVYDAAGSTARTLLFTYTVRQGDNTADLDYNGTGALYLNGGTVRSADGGNASLYLPGPGLEGSLGHSKDIAIDGAPPSVLRVSSPDPDGTYGTGRIINVTVHFDEPVYVSGGGGGGGGGAPALALATTPPRNATYAGGGNGTSKMSFLYVVQPGDEAADLGYAGATALSLDGAAVRDRLGNEAVAASLQLPAPGAPGSLSVSGDIKVDGAKLPVLAAADDMRGYADNSSAVAALELGGRTYAAVTSEGGDGVQLVRVHENGTLSAAGWINGSQSHSAPNSVDVLDVGSRTYVVTTSWSDRSVQVIGVDGGGGSGSLYNASRADRGQQNFTLGGPGGVASFKAGGAAYVIVASGPPESGVEVIRVNASGGLEDPRWLGDDSQLLLRGARGMDVFEMPANDTHTATYAIVAAAGDDGVQLFRVNDGDGSLAAAGQLGEHNNSALELNGTRDVDAFRTAGGRTYAIVASHNDNGVQLVRVHENGTLEAAAGRLDASDGPALDGASAVRAFAMGGRTYAAVASENSDAVQLVRVHEENGTLSAAGAAIDDQGFPRLDGTLGIDVLEAGGRTYAIATSWNDHGVQLIRLSRASVAGVSPSLPDGTYPAGYRLNVTVDFDGPVAVSGPPPSLLLAFDGGDRAAEYLSGNGTSSLVFNYTVRPGDNAERLDYAGRAALTTRGIVYDPQAVPALTAADLELPAPGSPGSLGGGDGDRGIAIDTAAAARVVGVSSKSANGTYASGDVVDIAVRFSARVDVEGAPVLELATAPPRNASYLSGGGTVELVFRYEVQPGDTAARLDYAGPAALVALGSAGASSSITGPDGVRAVPGLPPPGAPGSLGHSSAVEIEGVLPSVLRVSFLNASGTYGADSAIAVAVRFSEDVIVTGGPPRLALSASPAAAATYASGNGSGTLVFVYTVRDGDAADSLAYAGTDALDPNGARIADAAGNDATAAVGLALPDPDSIGPSGIAIDGIAPYAVRADPLNASKTYGTGSAIHIAVRFSENVTVFGGGPPLLALSTSPPSSALYASGNGTDELVFVYTVRDGDAADSFAYAGTDALDPNGARIADAAANDADRLALPEPEGWAGIAVDGRPPQILRAEAFSRSEIRVTFDEPVRSGDADADVAAGWSISGPDVAAGLSIESGSGIWPSPSNVLTLVLGGAGSGRLRDNTAPDIDLSYDAGIGGIADGAGNALPGNGSMAVLDRIPPRINSSLVVADDRIEIRYTEPVDAPSGAYSGLVLDGTNRTITGVSSGDVDSGSDTHTLEFSPPEGHGARGTVTINQTAVRDKADKPNRLGSGFASQDIHDERILTVTSSKIAGPGTATITYTRDAVAQAGDYSSLVVDGQNRSITGLTGGDTRVHELAFDPDNAPPYANGTVAAGVPGLYGGVRTLNLTDGQLPMLLSATAVSANTIRVIFSEPVEYVDDAGAAGALGWSVSGGGAEGLNVSATAAAVPESPPPPSAALSLALDGPLRSGTAPAGATLLYDPNRGAAAAVADPAGNKLAALAEPVLDGIPPVIESALVAGPNNASIMYSEAVSALPGAYRSIDLADGSDLRPVVGIVGNGTRTHTIEFGGAAAPPGTQGTLMMNATAVLDLAGNRLGPNADLSQHLDNGQAVLLPPAPPGHASVVSAVFTSRNAATITYSDALDKPAGRGAGSAYESVVIAGEGDVPRPVTGEGGLGTAVHTVEFGGDGIGEDLSGTVRLAIDLEGAANDDDDGRQPLRFAADTPIPVSPGRTQHTDKLARDQPNRTVAIEPDGFTREVDATAAGPGARPAVDVSALAVESEPGTVRFPPEPVALAAEFGRVEFPPNATAVPAPPDGVIFLRALPAGLHPPALAAAVAAALGHQGPGGIELRGIVEVAAGAGAPLAFDRPVRIFLADQSGGRAFYVNGSGATAAVAPIDTVCVSDDAGAVHRQLGGAGECHLDVPGAGAGGAGAGAAAGGKAIYTYHLTLFGTARTGPVGPVDPEPVDPEPVDPVDPADRPEPSSVHVLRRAGGSPVDSAVSYTAGGQDIAVEVRFTAPVAVDTAGGVPYIELRTGSAGARAAYSSGSGTDALEFSYTVRGGDIAGRLSYAGTNALALDGGAIAAVAAAGSGPNASTVLPAPGSPGSLSAPGAPVVRIDPEPGRPVMDVGILDDDDDDYATGAGGGGSGVSRAALAAAYAFNEEQGRTDGALLVNATAYDAAAAAAAGAGAAVAAGSAAAEALRAAHAGGSGPSVYVGPSTDRGLHAAMPYAAANGIVLVSAGSTAPSLAVEDDTAFRFLPGGGLDAEALARLARTADARSMIAVLENATHGPPTAAGTSLKDATPPPQDRFSRALDAALGFVGVPSLSGTVVLEGAAGGSYEAAAAAEALDAAVRSAARSAPVAVVYVGSPQGLAALATASASYPALASAAWIASGQSANSSLLAGDGSAAAFAAQAGLQAVRWSLPASDLARAVDSLPLPPGGALDAGARHRAYAAYDAMSVIGTAAALAAADLRGDTPDAAAVAELVPGTAAAYDGALGDIALNYAGDLWVPAVYDLWTVTRPGGGAGTAAEWTEDPGALDETRACSIALTRAKIDYGPIDSGQTSRPHLQTIVNTGQLPFSRVDLTSTPWHVDSPGNCEPGDTPSLPVGLSEVRTVAGGTFSDLVGSGTVLAQGLEAGSRSPLWYRLSLAGYADLPQAEITQCATYVVRCG